MIDFKVGDKVVCVYDQYDKPGQKLIHVKVGQVYEVVGEQFGTIKVKGCALFFPKWRFKLEEIK